MVRCLLYTVLCFFLMAGLGSVSIHAQVVHNHAMCGVDAAGGDAIKQRMFENRRNAAELLRVFENGRSSNNKVYVPIQFYIVKRDDGTGGERQRDIMDNLCKLNADYDSIGIQFYLASPIRSINQSLLYEHEIGGAMGNYFMSLYREPGVVNVFVGNRILSTNTGGTLLGYYSGGLDVIFCIQGSINGNNSTLTHEMGHFLTLPHTFSGWENQAYSVAANAGSRVVPIVENAGGRTPTILPTGALVETIPRTGGTENCQLAGDGFCDTEPNYLFGFYRNRYNDGCDYTATAMDPNGWLFNPSTIAPEPTSFTFDEGEDVPIELWLKNNSTKDRIFQRTLVVVEAQYTLNGTTVTMWSDTLGNSDTTQVGTNTANSDRNIIGFGGGSTLPGYINFAGHNFTTSVRAPSAPSLTFQAAQAEYSILNLSNIHRVEMDSLRITNPATSTVTVPASTDIIITDIFSGPSGSIASQDRTPLVLPNALAPGESYTFYGPDLVLSNTNREIAGVNINFSTYAPYRQRTIVDTDNVMSYYDDACTVGFTPEQAQAMKTDIASRGFATLYPAPPQVDITTQANLLNPVDGAVAPQPLIHFMWDAVPGAKYYEIEIYQINALGNRLLGGDTYEFMVAGTDFWLDVVPNQNYKWTVFPINDTEFCDRSVQSVDAQFQVFDWSIGVDQVQAPTINSSIYPNPAGANRQVTLSVDAKTATQARITMFNSVGQSLMPAQDWDLNAGNNVQQLNTAGLPAGLYIVNIETEEGVRSHKLTIEK